MKYFLGMKIDQSNSRIFLSQKPYAFNVLKKFRMDKCKAVSTPLALNVKLSKGDDGESADATLYRSLMGSLLYLTTTRPDFLFAASYLSRFMQSPTHNHFVAAKRVLRYVKGTSDLGLCYTHEKPGFLVGYVDGYWGGSVDDMKSTSGYVFSFGSVVFCWNSRKQEIVAQSTTEAEYVTAAVASSQDI